MVQEINLKVPTSYADISLKKYLELQKELKNYEGEPEASTAVMLYHLCGLEPEWLNGLSITDYSILSGELSNFIANTELPLQKIIRIGDIEYGFEPNLSQMSYGAYADITKFETITIDDNWAKIINILYRPITRKIKDAYEIEPYTGDSNWEKWLKVPMDIHFGALFFFVLLLMDLQSSTLNSLTEKEQHPNIKQILQKSGQLIQQSMN